VIDPRPEVSPVTQRVLVAEDEVLVRLSVAEGLRNEGLEVPSYVRAHCPGTALVLASAMTPPINEASGFDAIFVKPYQTEDIVRWIKRRRPTKSDPFEEQLP
jgi:hypothetical protein